MDIYSKKNYNIQDVIVTIPYKYTPYTDSLRPPVVEFTGSVTPSVAPSTASISSKKTAAIFTACLLFVICICFVFLITYYNL